MLGKRKAHTCLCLVWWLSRFTLCRFVCLQRFEHPDFLRDKRRFLNLNTSRVVRWMPSMLFNMWAPKLQFFLSLVQNWILFPGWAAQGRVPPRILRWHLLNVCQPTASKPECFKYCNTYYCRQHLEKHRKIKGHQVSACSKVIHLEKEPK